MKKHIYLMLLFLSLVPFLLYAGPGNPGQGPMGMGSGAHSPMMGAKSGFGYGYNWLQNPRMLDELNLTDKQREKIYKIKTRTEKDLIDLGAALRKAEIDLKDAAFADKIDESKIKNLIKKINKLRGKIFEKVTFAKLDSWKILTSEQRQTVKKYMLYRMNQRRYRGRGRNRKW